MGMPVVSTTVGCEGLDARPGSNLLVADTAEEFAEAVRRLLRDAGLRQRLGAEGRRTAERNYSWDVIGARMVETYEEILQPESWNER
jgi:glycosyltransferase involved in cell wall biosynthesis